MKHWVIITAGGKGTRTGAELPKQFLPLKQEPVLSYSIYTFNSLLPECELIVSLPEEWQEFWHSESQTRNIPEHQVVKGGETRFHSVKNALEAIPDNEEGFVWIHDGARPLTGKHLINGILEQLTNDSPGLIPVIPVSDSLRIMEDNDWKSVPRENFRLVQTPQVFPVKNLKQAYKLSYNETFSDDSVVYERAGFKTKPVEGDIGNIKLTWPEDFLLAEFFLEKSAKFS